MTELDAYAVDVLMHFFDDEPCNYNGMNELSDCDYCITHCENHNVRECWENAIKNKWYEKMRY